MRTTLDLPDHLFRQVKAKAALDGVSLKDLLSRFVEAGLRHPTAFPPSVPQRSVLPVIKRSGGRTIPSLTSQRLAQLEQEGDLAKLDRSFGRKRMAGAGR